jgi:hypothetical protein
MSGQYYDPGTGPFVVIDGMLVERDALNIAERVSEYDPRLAIMCADPEKSGLNDAPFLLIWENNQGVWERVFEFWELDERVLERVWAADQQKFDGLARLESMEDQIRKQRESRYREVREENKEKMLAAVVNKSSSFSIHNDEGDLIKIHENAPREINKGKRSFSDAGNRFNVKG